jgi:hypothetical protein
MTPSPQACDRTVPRVFSALVALVDVSRGVRWGTRARPGGGARRAVV